MKCIQRLCASALCSLSLLALAGCQPERKVVATVNNVTLGQEDFFDRVQLASQIPQQLDAGSVTIVYMIQEELTHQLATQLAGQIHSPGVTEEQVTEETAYQLRTNPQAARLLSIGRTNRSDMAHSIRFTQEQFFIGTNGDKASEAELKKTYDEKINTGELTYSPLYTVRILQVRDETKVDATFEALKKTGDFEKAGQALGMSPIETPNLNKDNYLLASQLPPDVKAALDSLKPKEFAPKPFVNQIPNPQDPSAAPQTVYTIIQLISKTPEHKPTFQEARPRLEHNLLEQSHPTWETHFAERLSDFTTKAQIHINLQRYERLADFFIKPKAAAKENPVSPPVK